jgi:hypothetical protein
MSGEQTAEDHESDDDRDFEEDDSNIGAGHGTREYIEPGTFEPGTLEP